MILKRHWPVYLHKKNQSKRILRTKDHHYELVENTEIKRQNDLEVVLTAFVDGIGARGDVVKVRPYTAYNKLLLPGLAVYPTPENISKYARKESDSQEEEHSSPHAQRCVSLLGRLVLGICMNKFNPWVIEKWHIRAALRRASYNVMDDNCIQLPDKPIRGPDLNIQNKEFFVTVTVNNCERARVRCRIHHWAFDPEERLPHVFEHWKLPAEPLFVDEANNQTSTTDTTKAE